MTGFPLRRGKFRNIERYAKRGDAMKRHRKKMTTHKPERPRIDPFLMSHRRNGT